MPTLIKELGKRLKGSMQQTEDWWRLMKDDQTGEQFVEHEWSHSDLKSSTDSGTERISIEAFLASTHPWSSSARDELRRVLEPT